MRVEQRTFLSLFCPQTTRMWKDCFKLQSTQSLDWSNGNSWGDLQIDHGDKIDFNKEEETQNLQRYRHREVKFCARHDNCGNTVPLSVGDLLLHSRQLHWTAYCVRLTSILNARVNLGCILKPRLFSPAGAMVELLLVSVPASTPTE